jgi:Tfp pilus assembly protein PilZ
MNPHYLIQYVNDLRRLEKKAKNKNANYTVEDEKMRVKLTALIHQALQLSALPQTNENRKTMRVPVEIRLTYENAQKLSEGYARNLSSGGLYFENNQPLSVGMTISLVLYLRDKNTCISVEGEIVWESQEMDTSTKIIRYKHGAKFIKVDPTTQEEIDAIIDTTAFRQAEATVTPPDKEKNETAKPGRPESPRPKHPSVSKPTPPATPSKFFGIFGKKQ